MPNSIARTTNDRFVFRKNANIGAPDAIEDENFLFESFVDTGDLDTLRNRNPKSIIVGRTGAGKTALLEYLRKDEERTVRIDVADLALNYISNNTVIKFFANLDVNLDLFYKLLWRHVLAVEIIRKHYKVIDEETSFKVIRQIKEQLSRNGKKQAAFEYFTKHGTSFWKDTDERVQELTRKTESDLNNSANIVGKAGISSTNIQASLNTGNKELLSEEEKIEIAQRGQEVIDKVQMAELTRIMEIINDDILIDDQKRYYITIDRLDEYWVDENLKYRLIRSLIETTRDFNSRVKNLKVILALREDLIERVFRYTRDSGQQEEKYQAMNLYVRWEKDCLVELLDKRVNQLVREQYTNQNVSLRSILPAKVTRKEEDPIDYIISRTMMRPRDAIMFFNECIEAAQGKATINKQRLLEAEAKYSFKRLNALRDEWNTDYPNLIRFCLCLKKFPQTFKVQDVIETFDANILNFLTSTDADIKRDGYLYKMSVERYNQGNISGLIDEGLRILHKVGVVGVKAETYLPMSWSYLGQKVLSTNDESVFQIHPMFWRVLGIEP